MKVVLGNVSCTAELAEQIIDGLLSRPLPAPGKTTERFLDRTIELPDRQMTLADLEGEPNGPRPDWRPSSIGIMTPEDERDTLIVFPATKITLIGLPPFCDKRRNLRLFGVGIPIFGTPIVPKM